MKPEIDLLGHLDQDLRRDVRARLPRVRAASLARRLRELGKPVDWAYEIVFAALLGGVIGARAYYVIQNYSEVRHDLLGSVFSGSGLVWYGGVIGGAIAVLAWMRWREVLELRMFDMCATALALGYAIGRIGCQVSGDGDYGIRSSLPWAMGYPHGTLPTPPGVRVQPTPIYETVAMCLLAYVLWQLRDRVRPGRRARAVSRRQRAGALPRGVHPPQQGGARRADRAAAREPRRCSRSGCCGWRDRPSRRPRLRVRVRRRRLTRRAVRRPFDGQLSRQAIISRDGDRHESLSAFPLGSRLNERGRLEVGGCDTIELAGEFGTPAYVVAEEDLRARARAFVAAGREAGHEDFHVVFASKAFPCSAVLELFAGEGLWCDAASGGELHLALAAGFAPERIVLHGNAKSEAELRMALRHRVGLIVIDNFDEIARLQRLLEEGALADRGPQPVLIRVTPDVRGETHEKISTGQADSKFGFAMLEAGEAIARVQALSGLSLRGVHAHIGSQLLSVEPFRREAQELAQLGEFPVWDLGGGLGVQYTAEQAQPPGVEEYVGAIVAAANAHGMGASRLMIEPGRALCANAAVTLYTVESVKQNVSRWVAVDGGMSDNLRPMLYGAAYEAHVADRFAGATRCVLAGKHCESGDVIVREALLDDPRPGDVIVTAGHGRLRICAGQQLQRGSSPARDLLQGRRRARGGQARELRGPDRARCPLSRRRPPPPRRIVPPRCDPSTSACSATEPWARRSPSCSSTGPARSSASTVAGR